MDRNPLWQARESVGHPFRDLSLLETALTHPSYCNEERPSVPDNQRLEFLGDAVVNLAVAAALYERLPDADEGCLTRARAHLVSRHSLAEAARRLGVGPYIRVGRGARLHDSAPGRDSVLSAVFEAIVGAVYLDAGFETAAAFVLKYLHFDPAKGTREVEKDPKTALQEHCQALYQATPRYYVRSRTGPPHAPRFEVQVTLPDGRAWRGEGGSRKQAEQEAARKALEACKA